MATIFRSSLKGHQSDGENSLAKCAEKMEIGNGKTMDFGYILGGLAVWLFRIYKTRNDTVEVMCCPPHPSLFGRELLAISYILNATGRRSTRGDKEKDDIGTNELDAELRD